MPETATANEASAVDKLFSLVSDDPPAQSIAPFDLIFSWVSCLTPWLFLLFFIEINSFLNALSNQLGLFTYLYSQADE